MRGFNAVFGLRFAGRIVCLDIPDNYAFMEPALIELLEIRLAHHLPRDS